MAISKDLALFVEKALSGGQSKQDTQNVLLDAGWSEQEIGEALAVYHDSNFPIPVPKKHYALTARDTVFNLLHFVLLYVACWGLIELAFDIINLLMPATGGYSRSQYAESGVRYWAAFSIVFVPAYLFVAYRAERRHKQDATCPLSTSRQWLTYLTLFFAAMMLLGDAVAILNAYLSGDLTLRLFYKIVVIATVAGTVMTYYWGDIQKAEAQIGKLHDE